MESGEFSAAEEILEEVQLEVLEMEIWISTNKISFNQIRANNTSKNNVLDYGKNISNLKEVATIGTGYGRVRSFDRK